MGSVLLLWAILTFGLGAESISLSGMTRNRVKIRQATSQVMEGLLQYTLERTGFPYFVTVCDQHGLQRNISMSDTDGVSSFQSTSIIEFLGSYGALSRLTNVYIYCNPTVTIEIFRQIKSRSLESSRFTWFILAAGSMDINELKLHLREGSQVVLIEDKSGGKFSFFSNDWDIKNNILFRYIGSWYSAQLEKYSRLQLQKDYRNFNGRILKSGLILNAVSFNRVTYSDGSYSPWTGVDHSLLQVLSERHNFKLEYVRPADGMWGGPQEDGTITGLIGITANHTVHMASNFITVTGHRDTVVDFTYPYLYESSTLVSKTPSLKNKSLAIVQPYPLTVWILIFSFIFVIGLSLWVMHKLLGVHHERKYNLDAYVFNSFRTLLIQGNKLKTSYSSLRILILFWTIFSLIANALYSGTLVASFASIEYEKPLDTLQDCLVAFQTGRIFPIVRRGAIVHILFKEAKDGIYHDIHKYFHPQLTWTPPLENYNVVLRGEGVIFASEAYNMQIVNRLGEDKFHIGKEKLIPQTLAVTLPSGSPYTGIFSKTIIRLAETGLLDHWYHRAMQDDARYNGVRYSVQKNLAVRVTGNQPINLIHLQAAFYVTAIGFVTSTLSFFLEKIFHSKC